MSLINSKQRGYIILEGIIALLIAGMVVVFLGGFLQSAINLRSFSSQQTVAHYEALHVLQQIKEDVRSARAIDINLSGTQLILTDSDHIAIRYTFNNGVVSRARNSSPIPMTERVSGVSFRQENDLLHAVIIIGREEFNLLVGPRL